MKTDLGSLACRLSVPFAFIVMGSYTLDTQGSSFDTVLYVYDTPNCTEIACDDDTYGLQSEVFISLQAAQQVVIIVDGYDSFEYGSFVLNIN